MDNTWRARLEKMGMIYNKALETSTLTGIALSHMLRNVMPASMKSRPEETSLRFKDRRHGRRIKVDRTITGMSNGNMLRDMHLIDISKGGMYVEVDSPSEIGPDVLFNLSGINLGPVMRVKGQVKRRGERGIAVQFS